MNTQMNIKDFLENEYSNSALYDCYRSIASYIDGCKPSARKVVYTLKKRNITGLNKVSRLSSAVAEETEYLHGEGSLQGVVVNMTQDFVGSNNVPLLSPNGNFGSRHIPMSSAARYIFSKKSDNFDKLFNKLDDEILISQEFEGTPIEPKFFVPMLPILLLNGSEGMGTGFAQKILPRKMSTIKRAIEDIVETGETRARLIPYYKGFKGTIKQGKTPLQWEIIGNFTIKNTSSIEITEIPIGYSLSSYLAVLNKLSDNGVIKSYEDLCENDEFLFKLKVSRTFTQLPKEEILSKLKLIKRVTENFTCIDEDNKIRLFDSALDILKAFIKIRLDYYEKRRLYLLKSLDEEISYLLSTQKFISSVIDKTVIVNNRAKSNIISQLDTVPLIIKKNKSYDYLLKMPIYSLTKEKIISLKELVDRKTKERNYLNKSTADELWKNDLKE